MIKKEVQKNKMKNMFIIHGHNETMELAVTNALNEMGLTIVILHEQPNNGNTIIEKIEQNTYIDYCHIVDYNGQAHKRIRVWLWLAPERRVE